MDGAREYRIKNGKKQGQRENISNSRMGSNHLGPVKSVKRMGGVSISGAKKSVKLQDLLAQYNPDDLINTSIEEHLLKLGYHSTYDVFLNEVNLRGVPPKPFPTHQTHNGSSLSDIKEDLFTAYRLGDYKLFTSSMQQLEKRINSVFPDRRMDAFTEMRLHVYMSIYHIHPQIASPIEDEDTILDITTSRLSSFKQYIEKNSEHFSSDDRFIPYLSIPYILTVDTQNNDSINIIYQKEWLTDLHRDMEEHVAGFCRRLLTTSRRDN